ncbi:methyltransferase domain-containing protein [Hyaloraphidium curvatum]|nr:methyltransferase domain-containing protein [Hyaloraphidium curvatum]
MPPGDRFSGLAPYIVIPLVTTLFVYATLPRPEASPPSAALSLPQTSFADANVDSRIREAVECLKAHGNFKDGCWWKLRRDVAFAALEHLASLPPAELAEFSFVNSGKTDPSGGFYGWTSMDLLVPTYECNFNTLRRFGETAEYKTGDGGKWMCGDLNQIVRNIVQSRNRPAEGEKANHAPCIVYSLGSNNQFGFEESVKKMTGALCDVHTFDCTGAWTNPSTTFHSWCLGIAPKTPMVANGREVPASSYKNLVEITSELKHEYVTILKMDIEGAEYTVFDSLLVPESSHLLPVVIFVELHTHLIAKLDEFLPERYVQQQNWVKPLWELYKKLDAYGYALVAKERNEWSPRDSKCCTEYLFMRIKEVQGIDLGTLRGFGSAWRSGKGGADGDAVASRLGISEKYPG